ncbi:putative glutathione S-transferase [Rosellinia necatrix]|uniref:Putative glutathione S-transferase n=1 Tax=Rosellinia necatrix TaxID=77044 RepID=A0A1W2TVN6_ROSNE|nr:putative glutathione S-transferase [Rosellinia necatrix]
MAATTSTTTTAGKPTLLHLSNSQSQTILWLLEELEIPYDLKLIDREKSGPNKNRAPAVLKETHPLGKSPQLITASGRVVIERSAITAYLIETYDAAGRFKVSGADEDHDGLREQELVGFAEASFNLTALTAMMLHYTKVLSPFFVRPLVAAVSAMLHVGYLDKELDLQLRFMDGLLARGQPYFLSDTDPTRVDFVMIFFVQTVHQSGVVNLAPYPNVLAWHDRCVARPAWKRGMEKGNGYNLAL